MHRPRSGPRADRDFFAVGNCDACAIAADPPSMERTLNGIPEYFPAMAKMGADVWAVRIEQIRFAVLRPKQNKIAPEIANGPNLANGQVTAAGDTEPADRKRGKWKP